MAAWTLTGTLRYTYATWRLHVNNVRPKLKMSTQIENVRPKFKVLGHLSNHFHILISNTAWITTVCRLLHITCHTLGDYRRSPERVLSGSKALILLFSWGHSILLVFFVVKLSFECAPLHLLVVSTSKMIYVFAFIWCWLWLWGCGVSILWEAHFQRERASVQSYREHGLRTYSF